MTDGVLDENISSPPNVSESQPQPSLSFNNHENPIAPLDNVISEENKDSIGNQANNPGIDGEGMEESKVVSNMVITPTELSKEAKEPEVSQSELSSGSNLDPANEKKPGPPDVLPSIEELKVEYDGYKALKTRSDQYTSESIVI